MQIRSTYDKATITDPIQDDEQHDQTFEQHQQHASPTYAALVSTLTKGAHVIIRGRPCKILEISKIGTNIHLVARDIFTDRILSDDIESTQSVEIPHVYRNEYMLVSILNNYQYSLWVY